MNKLSLTTNKRLMIIKNKKNISHTKLNSQIIRNPKTSNFNYKCKLCMLERNKSNVSLTQYNNNNNDHIIPDKQQSSKETEHFELQVQNSNNVSTCTTLINNNYLIKSGERIKTINCNNDGGKVNLFNYKYCKPFKKKDLIITNDFNHKSLEDIVNINNENQYNTNVKWNGLLKECKTVDYLYTGFQDVNNYTNTVDYTIPTHYQFNTASKKITKSKKKNLSDYLFTSTESLVDSKKCLMLSPTETTITKTKRMNLKSFKPIMNTNIHNKINNTNIKSISLYKYNENNSGNVNGFKTKSFINGYIQTCSNIKVNNKKGNDNKSKGDSILNYTKENKHLSCSLLFTKKPKKQTKAQIFDLTINRYLCNNNEIKRNTKPLLPKTLNKTSKSKYKVNVSPSFIYPSNNFV